MSDASRRINANRPIDWGEWECRSLRGGGRGVCVCVEGRISFKCKKVKR